MIEHDGESKLAWWREARFGLFVHWGLYAVPAGVWNGEPQPSVGEWIMKRARIPVKEYERLAERFSPVRFDAQEWVNLAREAGMKYIVITAKHHDGFAMFRSASASFNIADATPFGRDPLRELADACAAAGIKLCFYYSQYQDWHHPDAAGNNWDYPDEAGKRFDRYMEEKALPQMRELMTGFGTIGLIWYDTPMAISADQSRQFAAAVRELQPDCLLNSRVGHGYHDYVSTGDNQVPADVFDVDWEVPATMNHTWGYKEHDTQWKSAAELIRLLVDVNRKGGNFLLNVGPRADGTIPEASADTLREIGRWLRTNGEAIYGTALCPTFPYKLQWGEMTHRPGKLYLHFFSWRPGGIVLFGLQNRVKRAYLLADPDREVNVQQFPSDATQKLNRMRIDLPLEAPDPAVSVVVLEYEGELGVDKVQALLA